MKFRIAPEIVEKIPGINVAILVLKNLNNKRKNSNISQLLRGVIAEKSRELKDEEKKNKIQNILKQASFENKTLNEVSLLKSNLNKIGLGKELDSKNNLLDLAHYLSIKYLVPLYGRDLDQTEKDLQLEFIITQKGKRAEDLDYIPETENIVMWLVDIGSHSKEDFVKLPEQFATIIQKYCGGEKEALYFLNAEQQEIDLNYISAKETQYKEDQEKLIQEKAAVETILTADTVPFLTDEATSVPQTPEALLQETLALAIEEVIKKYLSDENIQAENIASKVHIETPHESAHGDYATNIALKIGKQIGKPPHEVAQKIIEMLPPQEYLEKTEIAGPGFINFYLSPSYLQKQLQKILQQKQHYGRLTLGAGKKVAIEYSSPNIGKPIGVHHLLSTIIGQTLVDLFRFAGFEVVALNHPGDWGTQFGKLLYAYKNWGNEEEVKKDPLSELLKLYVRFHSEAEKDPTLEDKGRAEFRKLEEGDEENFRLWRWMKEMSIEAMEDIYRKFGVHYDEYLGEQMYLEKSKDILKEGLEKGIFTIGERGALIVQFENDQYPPYMVQKADGTTLYSTRDLASIKDRLERYKPNKIIYVVDVAQSLNFKQLFATAHKLEFNSAELVHVVFGRMQLPEGKMSTRKGDVILVDEVIKEAVSRTEKLIEEKSHDLLPEEKKYIAENMAISAIKYNIISQNRETNITFSWDRMLSLDGNSGPYLQYACARAQSILRKYVEVTNSSSKQIKVPQIAKDINQTSLFSFQQKESAAPLPPEQENLKPFEHPTEQKLLRLLVRFPEHIQEAIEEYKPHFVTGYLFELARVFSSFYNEVPVLNAGKEDLKQSRLQLVEAVATVLKNGLKVLGITIFERM